MRRPGLSLKLSVLLMLGVVGAMVVDFSLTSGTDMDRARVLVFVVIALAMAMAAAVVLDKLVIGPLVGLSAQARRMEERGYAEPFIPSGFDEPRELGEALEHLRKRVLAEREELQRLNAELEQRVAERTAALGAAQAALVERERLVAVGRLGAGVAHEVNNPAGVILGRAGLLLDDATTPEAQEDLRVIMRQAERIRDITGALLRLGRPSRGERVAVDLAGVARSACELARREASDRQVRLDIEAQPSEVVADAAALEQVAYNLVRNAVHASPPGGVVTVVVSGRSLSVSDEGGGIPAEALPHLFESFFTTKAVGEGSGLGLAVAHGIVRDHGGSLTAMNQTEGGARFVMTLPSPAPSVEHHPTPSER